jgi:hypothetical protein
MMLHPCLPILDQDMAAVDGDPAGALVMLRSLACPALL